MNYSAICMDVDIYGPVIRCGFTEEPLHNGTACKGKVQRDKRDENVKRNEEVKSCHTFSDGERASARARAGHDEINPHGIPVISLFVAARFLLAYVTV